MRSRNLKPGFFANEELAECSPLARIFFAGLWCYADREGRFAWRPKRIKASILPYDKCSVVNLLTELEPKNFIVRYSINGDETEYGYIPKFSFHQNPQVREQASILPSPDKAQPKHGLGDAKDVTCHRQDRLIPDSLFSDSLLYKDLPRHGLGTFKNVRLTEEEYSKLKEKFPDADHKIDALSEYIASKGKKYKSHYATILTWARKESKDGYRFLREKIHSSICRRCTEADHPDSPMTLYSEIS